MLSRPTTPFNGHACQVRTNDQRRKFLSFPTFGGPREFSDERVVPFTQKQLFDLVTNVENYPKFLPFATSSRVLSSRVVSPTETEMEAELAIGFAGMEEKYTSVVSCVFPREITATSRDSSVFSELVTKWTFERVDDARSKVVFYIRFGFNNPLHSAMADLAFDKVSGQVLGAFESRCREVYPGSISKLSSSVSASA